MKVIVDRHNYVSSGQCVLNAGQVFDQRDEDGVLILQNVNPPADQAKPVHHAAAACPAQAIHVEE